MGVLFLLTGFPSVMGLLRNMQVGNPSPAVSCPSWDYCASHPQEIIPLLQRPGLSVKFYSVGEFFQKQ